MKRVSFVSYVVSMVFGALLSTSALAEQEVEFVHLEIGLMVSLPETQVEIAIWSRQKESLVNDNEKKTEADGRRCLVYST